MRRTTCLSLLTLAAAGALLAAGSPAAAAHAHATMSASALAQPTATAPTELVALERKMEALAINSETVELTEQIAGFGELGGPKKSAPRTLFSISGTVQLSPALGKFTLVVPFLPSGKTKALTIGGYFYLYEPELSRYDHGRPWVREDQQASEASLGINPQSPLGANPAGGAAGPFGRLIDDLDAAESIESLGPQTVDHEAVTEFAATVPLARLGTYTATKLGELERDGITSMKLELFIAASGLPVSARTILQAKQGHVIVRSDIGATNVPVSVVAPPVDKTITLARFEKLEPRLLRNLKHNQHKAGKHH